MPRRCDWTKLRACRRFSCLKGAAVDSIYSSGRSAQLTWAQVVRDASTLAVPHESFSALALVVEARHVAFAWSFMLAGRLASALATTILLIGAALVFLVVVFA